MTSPAPSVHVLRAFRATERPVLFPMGRGATWAAGDIVLKTVDDEAEAVWVAELARRAEPARADLSGEYERIVALVLSLVERP